MSNKAPKLSLSEQLAFGTVRIECELANGGVATGTGFFFNFCKSDKEHIPVIVTNKHVVRGALRGRFHLTLRKENGSPDLGNHMPLVFNEFEKRWFPHPDDSIDLCVMPMAPIVHRGEEEGRAFFFISMDDALIPTDQELEDLTQLEEIVMVGYPIGIWDQANNMPIFRKGVTATHPKLAWNGRPEFLIDVACFPGSSGSPVFLLNQGSYSTHSGITMGSRLKLLGILYAGPQFTIEGEVQIVTVPTQQKAVAVSSIPTNLGVVTRATNLAEFDAILRTASTGGAA